MKDFDLILTDTEFEALLLECKYEIDTAHIIYSYLKGSSSRSIIISDHWLEPDNNPLLDAALHDLLHKDN